MIVGRWITNASILRQRLEYLHCLKEFTKDNKRFSAVQVTVLVPKRSNFFVSANFDIAVSYISTLGTVSVTVVTHILVSASTESLSDSLSLLQFLDRHYSKLASSQWPTVTPYFQVSFFLQQGFCGDPHKQGHNGPLFAALKISFDISPGWVGYKFGVELAYFFYLKHVVLTALYSFANHSQVSFFLTHVQFVFSPFI